MKANLLIILAATILMVGCNNDYDLNQKINLKMSLLQGELGLPLTTMDLSMDSIINMVDFGSNFSEENGLYKIMYEANLDAQTIDAPEVLIPTIENIIISGIADKVFDLSGLGNLGVTLDQVIASELAFDIVNQENMQMSPVSFEVKLDIPSTLKRLKSVNFDNLYIIIETTLRGFKGDGDSPVASIKIEAPSSFDIEGLTSFTLTPNRESLGSNRIEIQLKSITNPDNMLNPPYQYQFTFTPTILQCKSLRITDRNAHATTKITIIDRTSGRSNTIHYTTLQGAFDIKQQASTEINLSDLMRDLKGHILTHGARLNIPIENSTAIGSLLNIKAYNLDNPQKIYISDQNVSIDSEKDTITYGDAEITAIITDRASKIIFDIEARTDPSLLYTFNSAHTNQIKAGYNLTVPFSFKKGSSIEVVETSKDVFNEIGDIADMIGSELYLEAVATNRIPFEIKMKLEALDANHQSILTLAEDAIIKAATSDASGLATDSQVTNIRITLTPSQLQKLKDAIDARITFMLITESNNVATVRGADQLTLKLSAKKGKGGFIINPNK